MDPVHPRDLRISDADRHRVAEHLREAAGEGRLDLEELDERLEATYAARTYADLVPLTEDLPGHRDLTPVDRPRPSPLPPGPPPGGRPGGQPASPFPPPSPTLADLLSSFSAGPRHAPPVPWSAPAPARPGPAGPPPGPAPGGTLAIMGDVRRRGPWQVGERHPVLALMGSVTLDLREAVLPAPSGEVTLVVTAVMGSVVVVVEHDTVLDVQGLGVMGTFDERTSRRDRADAGAAVGPAPTGPVVRVRGVALMGSVVVRRKGPRVGPDR
ncbi:hypothetical protein GCM10027596_09700 [Nocardioides korecus]